MTHRKDAEPIRTTRESEIFRDPPGSGNYSSSIGAAQGIELFAGSSRVRRARPTRTVFELARQIPVFAEGATGLHLGMRRVAGQVPVRQPFGYSAILYECRDIFSMSLCAGGRRFPILMAMYSLAIKRR